MVIVAVGRTGSLIDSGRGIAAALVVVVAVAIVVVVATGMAEAVAVAVVIHSCIDNGMYARAAAYTKMLLFQGKA